MSVTAVYPRHRVKDPDTGKTRFAADKTGRKRWRVLYRDSTGRQRDGGTYDKKADATAAEAKIVGELGAGTHVTRAAGRITFATYAADWMEAQDWRPSTRATAESHLNVHLLPAFGDKPLASITNTQVQRFVTGLSATLTPVTVDNVYTRLVSIFEAAVADRKLARSPITKVTLPKKPARGQKRRAPVFEPAQVEQLADAMPPRLRALVLVQALAGLRLGEALGLTVDRVDFLRREITVDRQLVTQRGGVAFGPPKTPASERTVPIPERLANELARHIEVHGTVDFDGEALLFGNRDGRPIRRNVATDAFHRGIAAAGLDGVLPDGIAWHALRHSYASTLISAGESVTAVQHRLGHATAAETLDTYSHLFAEADERTRQAVDAAYATSV